MAKEKLSEYVKKAQDGDTQSFAVIYSETYKNTKVIVSSIVVNKSDIDDLVQDSYVKLLIKLPDLKDTEKFNSWFNAIITNTCKDFLIKKKPDLFCQYENDDFDEDFDQILGCEEKGFSVEEFPEKRELSQKMKKYIAQLPVDQRICIVMHYYCEMKVDDIAFVLDISRNTVLSRLSYGRKKLEKLLEKDKKQGLFSFALFPFIQNSFSKEMRNPSILAKKTTTFYKVLSQSSGTVLKATTLTKAVAFMSVAKNTMATVALVATVAAVATGAYSYFSKPAETPVLEDPVSNVEQSVQQETAFDISHGNQYVTLKDKVVYCANNSVYVADNDFSNGKKIADGLPDNFVTINGKVYFIINDKLCSYSCEGDEFATIVDIDADYVSFVEQFFVFNSDSNIITVLNQDFAGESEYNINSANEQVQDGRIVYYDQTSNNLMVCQMHNPADTTNVIKENKDGFKLTYQVTDDLCIYPDFDSDITGKLNIYDLNENKTKIVNLDKPFVDFVYTPDKIYYSNYDFGVFSTDLDGKNAQNIYPNYLYFMGCSDSYIALYNSFVNTTFLLNTQTNKIEYVINQNVLSFEIYNGYILYKTTDNAYAVALSELAPYED